MNETGTIILRLALRLLPPFALWLAPIIALRLATISDPGLGMACVGAHVAGCYWMFYVLGGRADGFNAPIRLIYFQLLLAAPLTSWFLADVVADLADRPLKPDWMGAAGLSALLVWPAILQTLKDGANDQDRDGGQDAQTGLVAKRGLARGWRGVAASALWAAIGTAPFLSLLPSAAASWLTLGCALAHPVGVFWLLYDLRGQRGRSALRILVLAPAAIFIVAVVRGLYRL